MKRLVTLTKANSEFESYLLGSFSRTERAIPVQSLNISTGAEQVTFEIVAIEEIQVPKLFSKWARFFRFLGGSTQKIKRFFMIQAATLV